MKILQILPRLELGGVERGVVDLVRALKARGEESVVVSAGGALVEELQKEGIPHYSLPVDRKSLFSLSLVSRLVEIIQKERVEVVHARSRVPGWIAWLASRKAGVPLVTTCHGYYSNHFLSRVMGWGKRVIVPSEVIARHMIDDFGVPPDRIVWIPRGVDLSQFTFHSEKYSSGPPPPSASGAAKGPAVAVGGSAAAPKVFRILNVGRFSPIKGQVEFLRAVHRLRERGLPVEAWLVGSEGEGKTKYTREIERTVVRLGLENHVKMLGTRRDIPELLREADLLALSSLVPESFGRVLIEAGAVGTACVATRLGGVLDIIEDGKEGLLVPPRDEEAFADAMERLLTHRDEARQMAQALRKKVETRFTLDQMTEKTLEVYRQVKEEKRILVIKIGALGDVILAIPSLRMIRKKFPGAHLGVLVDERYSAVLAGCPYVNEVLLLNRTRSRSWIWLARFAKRLRREAFDLAIDFQNTKRTHFLAFLAGIPERHGFSRGIFGRLLNRPDFTFTEAASPVRHQFRLLARLGINQMEEKLELWPDPDSEALVTQWFEEKKFSENRKGVGLVIGSSPRWPTKRWPRESFHALARRLTKELDCKVVLIGSPEDRPLVKGFDSDSDAFLDLVGKTSLRDLISVIRRLGVLVTGDTAPLHIASALGTRKVALFGPTDPRRHLVPSPKTTLFVKRIPCQPCYKGVCHNPELLACLKRIEVDEVFEAVKKHLASLPALTV